MEESKDAPEDESISSIDGGDNAAAGGSSSADLLLQSPTTLLNELTAAGESSSSPISYSGDSPTTLLFENTSPTTLLNSILLNTSGHGLPSETARHLPPVPPLGDGSDDDGNEALDFDAILASVGKSDDDDDDDSTSVMAKEEELIIRPHQNNHLRASPTYYSMKGGAAAAAAGGGDTSSVDDCFYTPYQSEADTTDDDMDIVLDTTNSTSTAAILSSSSPSAIIALVPSTVTEGEESTASNNITQQQQQMDNATTDALIQEIMQDVKNEQYQQIIVDDDAPTTNAAATVVVEASGAPIIVPPQEESTTATTNEAKVANKDSKLKEKEALVDDTKDEHPPSVVQKSDEPKAASVPARTTTSPPIEMSNAAEQTVVLSPTPQTACVLPVSRVVENNTSAAAAVDISESSEGGGVELKLPSSFTAGTINKDDVTQVVDYEKQQQQSDQHDDGGDWGSDTITRVIPPESPSSRKPEMQEDRNNNKIVHQDDVSVEVEFDEAVEMSIVAMVEPTEKVAAGEDDSKTSIEGFDSMQDACTSTTNVPEHSTLEVKEATNVANKEDSVIDQEPHLTETAPSLPAAETTMENTDKDGNNGAVDATADPIVDKEPRLSEPAPPSSVESVGDKGGGNDIKQPEEIEAPSERNTDTPSMDTANKLTLAVAEAEKDDARIISGVCAELNAKETNNAEKITATDDSVVVNDSKKTPSLPEQTGQSSLANVERIAEGRTDAVTPGTDVSASNCEVEPKTTVEISDSSLDMEIQPTATAAGEEGATRIISSISTERIVEESLHDEEPAISPLTPRPTLGSSRTNDVFRPRGPEQPKPKALQVEFPSALDSSWKKSDAVSLSSASSTISHTSTNRGLMPGVFISPGTTEEAVQHRGFVAESKPPRVLKKVREENMNPKSFVDSLSRKLVIHDVDESTGHDDMNPVETRWIKQNRATSFNPQKSIFAGKVASSNAPAISPPGTPPSPVYSYSGIGGDEASFSDESQGMSSGATSADLGPEIGTWDMISEDAAGLSTRAAEENRPEFVVLPEPGDHFLNPSVAVGDDWVAGMSVGTNETGTGKFTRQSLKSFPSDVSQSSTSRRRRGMVRALSLTSRGSSRRSLSSVGSRGQSHIIAESKMLSVPSVKSEGHQEHALRREEVLDAASLGRESSLPNPRHSSEGLGTSSNNSSPDLRQSSSIPLSPAKLFPRTAVVTDAQSDDIVSPEMLALRFRRYDDELTEAGTKLEEELVAFSSIRRLDMPFRYRKPFDAMSYLGSLRWRQIVAHWKHEEMVRCMMLGAPSPHFLIGERKNDNRHDGWTIGSMLQRKTTSEGLELNGVSMNSTHSIRQDTKNFDGFSPQYCESTVSSMSGFLAEIGKGHFDNSGESLCHVLSSASTTTSIDDLLKASNAVLDQFSSFVEDVAAFAERNTSRHTDIAALRFSVCIKDRQAIEKKAERKYKGDIRRVKDILRAQITFPDEGSLVCGLVRLFQNVRCTDNAAEDGVGKSVVEVSRIKNLFRSESSVGNLSPSPLPTGYRHVLLNIRLDNGLLAEIQCNLSPLFDVLKADGYALHQELVALRHACEKREKSLGKGIMFDVNVHDLLKETWLDDSLSSRKHSSLFDNFSSSPDTNNAEQYGFASKSLSCTCENTNAQTDAEKTPQMKNKPTVQSKLHGVADLAAPDLADGLKEREGDVDNNSAVANEKATTLENSSVDRHSAPPAEAETAVVKVLIDQRSTEASSDSSIADAKKTLSPVVDPSDVATPRTGRQGTETLTDGTPRSGTTTKSREKLEIESLSPEKRQIMLNEIASHTGDFSGGDVFLAILEHGSKVAANEPRDVATFYCLYILFSYIAKRERGDKLSSLGFGVQSTDDVIKYSQACLLRCLKVSNQSISTGMTGWLAYGSCSPLERMTERPFLVLRLLAYDFGRRSQWVDAESVLLALVVNCEERLPIYHPTTLTALIDLAIVAAKVGKENFAERIVSRVAERLSTYLSEMENAFLSHLSTYRTGGKPGSGSTLFSIDRGRDSLFMLQAFASLFQSYLSREMITVFGCEHEIALANHCFVADSLSVLANCIAAARSVIGSPPGSPLDNGAQYWQLALVHYQRAFTGLSKTKSLDDPSISRAAYGIARCLRELGETDKALELLLLIVAPSLEITSEPDSNTSMEETKAPSNGEDPKENLDDVRFLPRPTFDRSKMLGVRTGAPKHISSALCLWLMATLALDKSPNEKGREEAFSYLHAASVKLQTALRNVSEVDDAATKVVCVEFLAMLEDEAMQIAEPIYE